MIDFWGWFGAVVLVAAGFLGGVAFALGSVVVLGVRAAFRWAEDVARRAERARSRGGRRG